MTRNYERRKKGKIYLFLYLCFFFLFAFSVSAQEKLRKSPPFPEPLKELKLPRIESDQLTNGLTVSLARREDSSFITMQLIVMAGEKFSPEKIPGLATFTADMFIKGAEKLSSTQVEEVIEYIGGTIFSATFHDYSVFTVTFLEEYLEVALDMLSRMILSPSFIRKEINSEKRNMFYELREREKESEYIAKRHLLHLLFEGHAYQKATKKIDVISNISSEDILDFFHKYYRPNNAILLFTGNLNLNTAFRMVSHYLNRWKNREIETGLTELPKPAKKRRIVLVDLPKERDATLYLGNVIFFQNTQDFFPFLVLNQVLGGTPNSRLFLNLRETNRYAYFAFSEVELFKMCGVFIVKAKVRPEVIFPSVEETLAEIDKAMTEEISSFEIEQAKSYLIGHFPIQIENLNDFSSNISKVAALNLGENYWNNYYDNIIPINAEKVFDVAQKYHPFTPVVVIVADREMVMDYLGEFQEIEVYNSQGIFQYTITKGVK